MTAINKRLASLYTPLEEAAAELRARHTSYFQDSDHPLMRHLSVRPYAVLSRFVATPNFELERFLSLASLICIKPVVHEFRRDKFVSGNPTKHALARLHFSNGFGRNGGPRISASTVADIRTADGCILEEVQTLWGQSLIEFHHDLLRANFSSSSIDTFNSSEWFAAHGSNAEKYYADFLSIFVSHGILFESYLLSPHERKFTTEIVIPAFEEACSRHGRRPLICRLDPPETEGDPYWLQYPHALRGFVAAKLSARIVPKDNEPNVSR